MQYRIASCMTLCFAQVAPTGKKWCPQKELDTSAAAQLPARFGGGNDAGEAYTASEIAVTRAIMSARLGMSADDDMLLVPSAAGCMMFIFIIVYWFKAAGRHMA